MSNPGKGTCILAQKTKSRLEKSSAEFFLLIRQNLQRMERFITLERAAITGTIQVKSFIWNLNLQNISRPKTSPNFTIDGNRFFFWILQDETHAMICLERCGILEKLVLSSFEIDLMAPDGSVAATICSEIKSTFFPTQHWLGGEHVVIAAFAKDQIGEDGKISLKCTMKVKSDKEEEEEEEGEEANASLAKEVHRFCDFNLKCGDQEIPVSRLLLAAKSPVFSAMCSDDSEEAKSGQAVLNDVDLKSLEALVKFCHYDRLDEEELTTDLLAAANKYKIRQLVKKCEVHLSKTMSVDDAIDYFLAAGLHEATKLRTAAKEFITENLVEIEKIEDFKNLGREDLVEILQHSCQKNK